MLEVAMYCVQGEERRQIAEVIAAFRQSVKEEEGIHSLLTVLRCSPVPSCVEVVVQSWRARLLPREKTRLGITVDF